ncbi:cobyric acid synthase [Trichloromonas sp.]|uniref:cobyric acid synthase n=1 Tax=Trichloromonas sp. TaxID=3069249 RepID=UPI003D8154A8
MNGTLYVVGIGPGGHEHMTFAAREAIEGADTVVGYKTYLDLIEPLLAGKEVVSSGMKKEVDRCREALELARSGRKVALVSSGDSGIYGMAGLVLELVGAEAALEPEIVVVPGVSAVQAAASRLGAPLMHDFAVISLSDLLTPWTLIRRRLDAAGRADFVVALYNPRSKGRVRQLDEAREILLRHRGPQTPVGIVRNACRPDETVTVTDLEHLGEQDVDMLSLVMIGNSATRVDSAGRMLTPRGYADKYLFETREALGVRCEVEGLLPLTPPPSDLTDKKCHALFIGGTGSDVGKSVIAAGLCRILQRRGLSVAPFKAQNMALNSAVTPEGGEIGRAQALQAAACGIPAHTDMNPVLLKPNSDTGSQVIIQGCPVGNMTVREYHRFKVEAFARVEESYARLAARHQVVVMEGAGSVAEVNLKQHDITNLKAAAMADAPVLLVADIDRGGVFAALLGTLELLDPAERTRIAGVIINRFRGDASLLRPGIELIEDRTGVPVLGVVPWLDLKLPEEDSVALARKGTRPKGRGLRIGVVRLPRISNYTDFDPLEREPDVDLVYLDAPAQLTGLDLLILPGTKSTLPDLQFLRECGLFQAIRDYHGGGGRVVGICGGYQMLGRSLTDPQGIESGLTVAEGLGLLDVETELHPLKKTHQVGGVALAAAEEIGLPAGTVVGGYEIHQGETLCGKASRPLLRLTRRSGAAADLEDGAVSADGRVWGTYLHGLFDDELVRRALLAPLRGSNGLTVPPASTVSLDTELDRLADHLQAHLDMVRIFGLIGLEEP